MSRAGILAFAAASVAGSGCGGVATTGTPGSGHTGGVSGAGGLVGAMDTGGAVPAVFYGAPFPVPMTGGSGGMGSGGDSGSLRDGGSIIPDGDGGSLCFNAFDQMPEPCCPEATPDCTSKPDGYPGFACTPSPGSFCSCTCEQGGWLCGC